MSARSATGAERYAGTAFACDPRSTSIQAEWGGTLSGPVMVKPSGGQKIDFHGKVNPFRVAEPKGPNGPVPVYGPRLRKGEVFAYVGLSQNLKDLKDS